MTSATKPDVLKVQGRMELGYGIIPKIPMQDQRLTIEAKAIYSYFCSYAGAGTTAFPSRDKILRDLQISENRYYKHFNLLKQYGYIKVAKNTDNKGKFTNNIYTLIEMVSPHLQNKGTSKPYLQNAGMENASMENEGAISNIIKINNLKNQQSESKSDMTMTTDVEIVKKSHPENEKRLSAKETAPTKVSSQQGKPSTTNVNNQTSINEYTSYKCLIQDNIHYYHFLEHKPEEIELVDELVNCMLDVICTVGDAVKVNGELKNREMVKSQYLKVNFEDIEHVLDRYKGQRHRITHLNAYLKTMLYTVKQESGHYYTNAVRADGVI